VTGQVSGKKACLPIFRKEEKKKKEKKKIRIAVLM
jgi:hypothetical protein